MLVIQLTSLAALKPSWFLPPLILLASAVLLFFIAGRPWHELPRRNWLRMAVLCRVPLILLMLLVAGPWWVSLLDDRGDSLVRNLFVLELPIDFFSLLCLTTMTAWVGLACLDNVVQYSDLRFPDLSGQIVRERRQPWRRRLHAVLLSAPLLFVVWRESSRASADLTRLEEILGRTSKDELPNFWSSGLGYGLAGVALALVSAKIIDAVREWAREAVLPKLAKSRLGRWVASWPEFLVEGYRERRTVGGEELLVLGNGHLRLGSYLFVWASVYVLGFFALMPVDAGQPDRIPTLAYVVALAGILCVALTGLSFFFDRWRVPLIAVVVGIVVLTSQFAGTVQHHFADHPDGDGLIEVREALVKRVNQRGADKRNDPIVIVAAEGGGLAASAWTVRVLAGLEQALGEDFCRSIVFTSGVSGGSVGLLHHDFRDYLKVGDSVVTSGSKNVLQAAAWGFLYPDLARSVIPWIPGDRDRGWALEETWARSFKDGRPGLGVAKVRKAIAEGKLPGFAFNTTAMETGDRVVLSYLNLNENQHRVPWVDPITAARLSATFPYVTPAARRDPDSPYTGRLDWHLLDGGYFDNSGTATCFDWLRAALEEGRLANLDDIDTIFLLDIDAYPVDTDPIAKRVDGPKPASGWEASLLGPLKGVISVRSGSQRERNLRELVHAEERINHPDAKIRLVPIRINALHELSLSWQLTRAENASLDRDWAIWRSYLGTGEHWSDRLEALVEARATMREPTLAPK